MFSKKLYEQEDYAGCDTLLRRLLGIDPEHMLALRMMSGVERHQGHMEEAIKCCEKMIELNSEAAYAHSNIALNYLKMNKPAEGLKWAEKSLEIDKNNAFNLASLAIAWHMNKQPVKRDAVLKELKQQKDTATQEQYQFAMDIINNKESL